MDTTPSPAEVDQVACACSNLLSPRQPPGPCWDESARTASELLQPPPQDPQAQPPAC